MTMAAVVLAAGLSRRMGRPKLLLSVEGKTILRWAVEGVIGVVDDLVVVTAPDDPAARASLTGLPVRYVENRRPEEGQGTSIAAGIAALRPETGAALIALADQPWLPDQVVARLLDTFRRGQAPIVAPVYRGTQGTPVVFGADVFHELLALEGDAGARRVVHRDPGRVAFVSIDAPMPDDVDTPEDLARVVAARARRVQ